MAGIKLITVDIDKTLIDDQMNIPQKNIDAIREAVNKGVNVAIVSGRSSSSIIKYMNILSLKSLIPSLGGCMLEEYDGTIIQDFSISCDVATSIYDIVKKHNEHTIAFRHRSWYTEEDNTYWNEKEFEATHVEGVFVNLRSFLEENEPNKIIMPCDKPDVIKQVLEELNNKFSNQVTCVLSSSKYLEIMPKNVDKGTSVNNMISYYHIKPTEVLAIGDYYNDLGMFKASYYKACPSNAPDDIKNLVDYVSCYDNNNAAVSDIIRHFLAL